MNKKGVTIMEIIVSLVMISVVMVFMFSILSDVKNEESMSKNNNQDTEYRTELINLIQSDFINSKIKTISKCTNASGICLKFVFKDNKTKQLLVNKNIVRYGGTTTVNNSSIDFYEQWTFNDVTFEKLEYSKENASPYYLLKIVIPAKNKINSNRKYDIELTDIGYIEGTSLKDAL